MSAALRLINLFMVVVVRSLRCGRIFLDLLRRGLLFSRYCGRRLRCYTWCYICAGSGAAVRIVPFVSGLTGSVTLLSAGAVSTLVAVALTVSGSVSVTVARFIAGSVAASCAASASGSASGGRGTAVTVTVRCQIFIDSDISGWIRRVKEDLIAVFIFDFNLVICGCCASVAILHDFRCRNTGYHGRYFLTIFDKNSITVC